MRVHVQIGRTKEENSDDNRDVYSILERRHRSFNRGYVRRLRYIQNELDPLASGK